jgi:hypothetical protein
MSTDTSLRPRSCRPANRWKTFFDHYVFQIHGDPGAHIARERRGLLGSLSPDQAAQSTAALAQLLSGMR